MTRNRQPAGVGAAFQQPSKQASCHPAAPTLPGCRRSRKHRAAGPRGTAAPRSWPPPGAAATPAVPGRLAGRRSSSQPSVTFVPASQVGSFCRQTNGAACQPAWLPRIYNRTAPAAHRLVDLKVVVGRQDGDGRFQRCIVQDLSRHLPRVDRQAGSEQQSAWLHSNRQGAAARSRFIRSVVSAGRTCWPTTRRTTVGRGAGAGTSAPPPPPPPVLLGGAAPCWAVPAPPLKRWGSSPEAMRAPAATTGA